MVNGVRSYSASAYYCPASRRKNLHVLTGAQVRVSVLVTEVHSNSGHQATKILFGSSTAHDSNLKATGVSFVSGAVSFTANASKEIILAAGAVQTPQLLELSGMFQLNFTLLINYNLSRYWRQDNFVKSRN